MDKPISLFVITALLVLVFSISFGDSASNMETSHYPKDPTYESVDDC